MKPHGRHQLISRGGVGRAGPEAEEEAELGDTEVGVLGQPLFLQVLQRHGGLGAAGPARGAAAGGGGAGGAAAGGDGGVRPQLAAGLCSQACARCNVVARASV